MREEAEREEAEARERARREDEGRRRSAQGAGGRLAKRNVQLLSFGGEGEGEEEESGGGGGRSKEKGIHAVVTGDARLARLEEERKEREEREERQLQAVRDRLRSGSDDDRPTVRTAAPDRLERKDDVTEGGGMEEDMGEAEFDAAMRAKALSKSSRGGVDSAATAVTAALSPTVPLSAASLKEQVKQLTRQVLGGASDPTAAAAAAEASQFFSSTSSSTLSALERRQQAFLARRKSRVDTSAASTLDKLQRFKQSIHAMPPPSAPPPAPSATPNEGDDDDDTMGEQSGGKGWLRHRLTFARRPQDYVKEAEEAEAGFVVLDPKGLEGSRGERGRGRSWKVGQESEGARGRTRGGEQPRRRREDDVDEEALPAELQAEVDAVTRAREALSDRSTKRQRWDVRGEGAQPSQPSPTG